MVIATVDIGGTGIKFAAMSKEGEILDKQEIATPNDLDGLLNWLKMLLSKREYQGIAMSVPGAVDRKTGTIGGISAVPYIHGFSWYDKLASYELPIHLENDANCVGLSELLAHPELENAACVVIGTGIGGAMIVNGRLHRGKHHLGGEFGYMTTLAPAEKLNNWSQLASTGNMVRYLAEKSGQTDWNGRKIYQEAEAGNTLCQEAIERMNRNLAQGLLNIQYLFDPDVISLGGSISQNKTFIEGVRSAISYFVDRYEEYSVTPEIVACTYQGEANLYGALVNWLQEEGQWPHS
ncbi:ROK family protein [Streptococcus sp. oral taxon 056 str. F0418]|uniref:ROK family protein n=1 Tax=Streptococcus sp. oral taxon 056 TaxID=712620 RepID=UPI00021812A0|nr:ROK family protein [Streptococcus sp. oral taxon 056]EGP65789.1 ROK family protein [Streptococcus sp. oral taxon 056 str. F0418]